MDVAIAAATANANAIATIVDAVGADATFDFFALSRLCFCLDCMVYKSDDAIAAYFDIPCRRFFFSP